MTSVRVVVDIHERRSAVPAALERLGAEVVIRSLEVGDYDVGSESLIERKTTVDLALSLEHGRFWRQLGELRRRSPFPILLIEGPPPPEAILGTAAARGLALAVIDQGVALLSSRGPMESAHWIADLATRRQVRVPRDRPPYAFRRRSPIGHPGEPLLCAIPGLSVYHARSLLERFHSVRGLTAATPEDWMTVRGIGPVRAKAMSISFGPGRPTI